MATRFMYKTLLTAALGIVLSPLLAATTAPSLASSNSADALQLAPPAAPSNCMTRTNRFRDPKMGYYTLTTVSWRDNSTNEDGFTVEVWQNQSGTWVLAASVNEAANSTGHAFYFFGRHVPDYRFRVKAFNASGESDWSNWGH